MVGTEPQFWRIFWVFSEFCRISENTKRTLKATINATKTENGAPQ
eukprot:gene17823-23215_t